MKPTCPHCTERQGKPVRLTREPQRGRHQLFGYFSCPTCGYELRLQDWDATIKLQAEQTTRPLRFEVLDLPRGREIGESGPTPEEGRYVGVRRL